MTPDPIVAAVASIPEALKRCLRDVHGADAADSWLSALPDALMAWSEVHRWELEPVRHPLSYNLVLPARRRDVQGERRAVLKMSVPGHEIKQEVCAVRAYQGRAMARCIDADAEAGWMLLEALEPGYTLHDEPEALAIMAAVALELHQSEPPQGLPHLSEWAGGFERLRAAFDGDTGPIPAKLVEQAEAIFAARAQPRPDDVLLHGDLHHGNILRDGSGWRAIDPKGVVGARGFEPTSFMLNALEQDATPEETLAVLGRCLDGFSLHLGLERRELAEWGLAQGVLSGIWMWEDHGEGWDRSLGVASAYAMLMDG